MNEVVHFIIFFIFKVVFIKIYKTYILESSKAVFKNNNIFLTYSWGYLFNLHLSNVSWVRYLYTPVTKFTDEQLRFHQQIFALKKQKAIKLRYNHIHTHISIPSRIPFKTGFLFLLRPILLSSLFLPGITSSPS